MKPSLLLSLSAALLASLSACSTCTSAPAAMAGEMKRLVNTDERGVALEGHDAVAFFTVGKPVKGSSSLTARHEGATYWFSSRENLAAFEAEPGKYAPAFGGYCGYAASIERVSPVDVEFFEILDGRLVLQHNQRAWDKWHEDLPGNLVKADANWPALVAEHGRGEKTLVNVDDEGVALEGHDPVAYFTEHYPVKGMAEIYSTYNGAIYRFASQEHRVLFESDPAKYAPAYGGFCGYAASINKVSPVNIHIFQVLDGRLVLQHTPEAYRLFNADVPGNTARADANWPGLVACEGS